VLDHALRQLLSGGVGEVFFQQPAQQIAVAADREADREKQLIAKRALIHRRRVLMMFANRESGAGAGLPVKGCTIAQRRCIAVCYPGQMDVEAEMVRLGLARDCPRYSGGRHHATELQAAGQGATIRETYRLPGSCRPR
jgi:hypothetical protein